MPLLLSASKLQLRFKRKENAGMRRVPAIERAQGLVTPLAVNWKNVVASRTLAGLEISGSTKTCLPAWLGSDSVSDVWAVGTTAVSDLLVTSHSS